MLIIVLNRPTHKTVLITNVGESNKFQFPRDVFIFFWQKKEKHY